MKGTSTTKILGHRGWSARYPENTCLAFERALQLGIQGIEFDVQLTKDGVPVIIHDPTVDRTTDGTGRVSALTVEDLRRFNAAAKQLNANEIGFQTIPTLDEVLRVVQTSNPNAFCNIEIKVYEGDGRPVVDTILRHVSRHPLAENILFSSFHYGSLAYLREQSSNARIGLLFDEKPADPWSLATQIGACAVNLNYHYATPSAIAAIHNHGLQVCVWTVDEPNDIESFIQQGTDIVITNAPDRALCVYQEV